MMYSQTGDLWWKNAVLYCADVQTFADSNGDGQGDLRGMTERIEYLADLGVTCLWLMPLYPTANRDDGYDITDFFGVDPRLGSHGDFVELVRTARSAGLRVIVDFVMNHTSDQHPWFRSACRSTEDPFRDYYVWSPTKPRSSRKEVVFPDAEDSIWELDERTGEWYLHHFYKTQPDLNVANPAVQEEIAKTLGFWLQLGVSGFRVDAVPFLFARDSVPGVDDAEAFNPDRYLGDVRSFVTRRVGEAMLLGEVNLPYEEQKRFFGGADGDGLNMQFDFIGMQRLYLSLARADATPLADALRERPALDVTSQWANFVRNHDELTLDKLSKRERTEVFDAFGPEPEMQLYDRGLRRRLPTMLGGDERRIRLVYSLMFSLPGTPVLFYGEEIGMGENLDIEGRLSVRTPMQWSAASNGGFSTAPAAKLVRPLPEGLYSPDHVNALDQRRDPDSLWNHMRRLIRIYRQMPQIGWSTVEVLDHDQPSVLAHVCHCDSWRMVALHNLGPDTCTVTLSLDDVPEGAVLRDALGHGPASDEDVPVVSGTPVELRVEGYAGRWLRLLGPGEECYL
ncbi:alpha-amylase family protein [Humibacillus xanthopallidus]|uniref:Trehalose synthase n=1 Tax=Humibacillus xanthopallidus TaxID=412689 RepID=A0A543HG10_9MICO|nr:alpha-amylase family protein [Humibacillus xanthopallidus]TQM57275.1 trehalose synthase [Humibacillus xanthopallidus]